MNETSDTSGLRALGAVSGPRATDRSRLACGLAALAAAALLWAPTVASACAVCTAGREEENQLAYLLTTLFMSALPLVAVGTLIFVLWRRIRKLEALDASNRRAAAPPLAPPAAPAASLSSASPRG